MKRPPRFRLALDAAEPGVGRMRGPELHHLRDVMRLSVGAEVEVIDQRGNTHRGHIAEITGSEARVYLETCAQPRPSAPLILAAAIIKGPRMDFLVEKAAELGATELWPLMAERGVVHHLGSERIKRWRRLASGAAKQSLAPVMEVKDTCSMAGLIDCVPRDILAVMCQAGATPLQRLIRQTKPSGLLILCGPEGDFTQAEVAAARAKGFELAGLGPNRLRSETAAIAALSIANAVMNELRSGDI